jgi:hypothetical protein
MQLSEVIKYNFDQLTTCPEVNSLFRELTDCGQVVIFGGAIRDWFLGNVPKDIDMVSDASNIDLKLLNKYPGRKNSFGGYKIKVGNVEFDIWNVESTWAFKHDVSFKKTLSEIPQTSFFNYDAVIFHTTTHQIMESVFNTGLESKILDIVYEPNPYPVYVTSKAFIMAQKYNLSFSDRLKQYLLRRIDLSYSENDFIRYQQLNYGKIIYSYEDCIRKL